MGDKEEGGEAMKLSLKMKKQEIKNRANRILQSGLNPQREREVRNMEEKKVEVMGKEGAGKSNRDPARQGEEERGMEGEGKRGIKKEVIGE